MSEQFFPLKARTILTNILFLYLCRKFLRSRADANILVTRAERLREVSSRRILNDGFDSWRMHTHAQNWKQYSDRIVPDTASMSAYLMPHPTRDASAKDSSLIPSAGNFGTMSRGRLSTSQSKLPAYTASEHASLRSREQTLASSFQNQLPLQKGHVDFSALMSRAALLTDTLPKHPFSLSKQRAFVPSPQKESLCRPIFSKDNSIFTSGKLLFFNDDATQRTFSRHLASESNSVDFTERLIFCPKKKATVGQLDSYTLEISTGSIARGQQSSS